MLSHTPDVHVLTLSHPHAHMLPCPTHPLLPAGVKFFATVANGQATPVTGGRRSLLRKTRCVGAGAGSAAGQEKFYNVIIADP